VNTLKFQKRLQVLEKRARPPGSRETFTLKEAARRVWDRDRDNFRHLVEHNPHFCIFRNLVLVFEREDSDRSGGPRQPQKLRKSKSIRQQIYKGTSSYSSTKAGLV